MLRAAVDLETTGVIKGQSEIIEIAILPFNDKYEILSKFHTFIRPLRGLTKAAQDVNHITYEMVCNAPTPLQVKAAFIDWKENILGDGKIELLGHNICAFDRPFLDYFFTPEKAAELFSHRMDDTMVLSRAMRSAGLLPKLDSCSLSNLRKYFNLSTSSEHRAYHDAEATLEVWKRLVRILADLQKK